MRENPNSRSRQACTTNECSLIFMTDAANASMLT